MTPEVQTTAEPALYALLYKGKDKQPASVADHVRGIQGVTVVNDQAPRVLILQVADDADFESLHAIDGWTLHKSQTVTLDL